MRDTRKAIATRRMSPSVLVRNACLKIDLGRETHSPVPKVFPDGLVQEIVGASGMTRTRVYRWLKDPESFEPKWSELTGIAEVLLSKRLAVMLSGIL